MKRMFGFDGAAAMAAPASMVLATKRTRYFRREVVFMVWVGKNFFRLTPGRRLAFARSANRSALRFAGWLLFRGRSGIQFARLPREEAPAPLFQPVGREIAEIQLGEGRGLAQLDTA